MSRDCRAYCRAVWVLVRTVTQRDERNASAADLAAEADENSPKHDRSAARHRRPEGPVASKTAHQPGNRRMPGGDRLLEVVAAVAVRSGLDVRDCLGDRSTTPGRTSQRPRPCSRRSQGARAPPTRAASQPAETGGRPAPRRAPSPRGRRRARRPRARRPSARDARRRVPDTRAGSARAARPRHRCCRRRVRPASESACRSSHEGHERGRAGRRPATQAPRRATRGSSCRSDSPGRRSRW